MGSCMYMDDVMYEYDDVECFANILAIATVELQKHKPDPCFPFQYSCLFQMYTKEVKNRTTGKDKTYSGR